MIVNEDKEVAALRARNRGLTIGLADAIGCLERFSSMTMAERQQALVRLRRVASNQSPYRTECEGIAAMVKAHLGIDIDAATVERVLREPYPMDIEQSQGAELRRLVYRVGRRQGLAAV